MATENSWSDADACAAVTRLIEGTQGLLREHDVENAIGHWRTCKACQDSHPNGLRTLKAIQEGIENEIRSNFVRLRHQFLSRKHELLADSSTNVSAHDEIIVALFNSASELQFDLGFVNGVGGLADFTLFPASEEDSEERGAWRNSGPFLGSLDHDTQQFAFTSLLTHDLLVSYHRLAREQTREQMDESQSRDPTDVSEKEVVDRNFLRLLSNSDIDTRVLVDMLERSSSSYRADYFAQNPPQSVGENKAVEATARDSQAIAAAVQSFHELKQEIEDLGDSLKASQDYLISQFLKYQQSASAVDPFLRSELGDEVYGELRFDTRRALMLAEYHYQQNKEPDGFNPCVNFFCSAYETEFTYRITEPLAAELVKSGIRDYPANSERRFAMLVHGRLRPSAVGSVVYYLKGDKQLRQTVLSLKLVADDVIAGADKFRVLRNPIAHGQLADKAYADRVRLLLLGPASILKDLIPK